jgi:hypothetical protein
MMKIICFCLFSALGLFFSGDQGEKIAFRNASFEDTPKASASPAGWNSLTPGSTPDILPGAWEIQFPAQHGETCVGLISREDGTVEDLGQTLSETLLKGKCYEFNLYLAHAEKYVGYDKPLQLRIWGGNTRGAKTQLLGTSGLINHSEWRNYIFQFEPKTDIKHITLEAFYAPGALFHYKGNIILDNISAIEKCDRA